MSPAAAQTKAVMEGVAASRWTVKVDTANGRVEIATTSYGRGGNGIANVGLFTTSNVVVGAGNAVVVYATGALVTPTLIVGGGAISPPSTGYAFLAASQSFTGANTFNGASTFTASVKFEGGTNIGQVIVSSGIFASTGTMRLDFPALESGLYRLAAGLTKDGTAATMKLRFNLDSGTNYDTTAAYLADDGSAANNAGDGFAYCFVSQAAAQTYAANGVGTWSWALYVNPDANSNVVLTGSGVQQIGADTWSNVATGCHYDGSASITSVTVVSDSGLMVGYMSLVKIQ